MKQHKPDEGETPRFDTSAIACDDSTGPLAADEQFQSYQGEVACRNGSLLLIKVI